jgi:hypothetical protein
VRDDLANVDGAAGWIGTPIELLRLAVHLDGAAHPADLVGAATLAEAATPSAASLRARDPFGFGRAIAVSPGASELSPIATNNLWWQRGRLPGASVIVVRTAGEFSWVAAANTPGAEAALDAMMWRIVSSVTAWPSHDLFTTP